MEKADIVIEVRGGNVVAVHATSAIKYTVFDHDNHTEGGEAPKSPDDIEVQENDTIGSYKQILKSLGVPFPVVQEFDVAIMLQLVCSNSLLQKAYEKAGFKVDAVTRAIARSGTGINDKASAHLKTIFNAMVKADERLMKEYLKIQE